MKQRTIIALCVLSPVVAVLIANSVVVVVFFILHGGHAGLGVQSEAWEKCHELSEGTKNS